MPVFFKIFTKMVNPLLDDFLFFYTSQENGIFEDNNYTAATLYI